MSKSEPRKLLEELTRLEGLRGEGVDQGKRQFERFVVRADAELTPMDRSRVEQQCVPVLLRDMGKGGIGFVVAEPLDVHSTWHVAFLKDGYIIGSQGLTVRHSKHLRDNAYLVGGQFCASNGLLAMLGVKPAALRDQADPTQSGDQQDFISPEDL
jgi:hypothetical protein